MTPVSVSELNEQIKNLLEATFVRVYVEGELSRITYHGSGHVYFTLKDAGSAVSCVMFRGNAAKLRFRLEEGLKVLLEGSVSVYKPRGQYQVTAFSIEPSGHGALALAYEQLKSRLAQKGYFDPSRKKSISRIPRRIALVTSATGAALQDMQRVAAQRWPLVKLAVYDTVVQGEAAAASIVRNLQAADRGGYDVIVIGRGGGSIEDLWAFNEEAVADAVFGCETPVVSAVGHEIDWVISDFVADLRAPTPSAAMQMLLPESNEMLMTLDGIARHYGSLVEQRLRRDAERVSHLAQSFRRHSIDQKILLRRDELQQLHLRFEQGIRIVLERAARELQPLEPSLHRTQEALLRSKASHAAQMLALLEANDPRRKSKKGFAQIVREGRVVELSALQPGERFEALDASVKVTAVVERSDPIA